MQRRKERTIRLSLPVRKQEYEKGKKKEHRGRSEGHAWERTREGTMRKEAGNVDQITEGKKEQRHAQKRAKKTGATIPTTRNARKKKRNKSFTRTTDTT